MPPPVLEGGVMTAEASRDTLLPALRFACARSGFVYTRHLRDDPDRIVFELYSLRDEPAKVTATRETGDGWAFEAKIGRFGDTDAEAALLISLGERLRALRQAGQ